MKLKLVKSLKITLFIIMLGISFISIIVSSAETVGNISTPSEPTSGYVNEVYTVTWNVNGFSSSNSLQTFLVEVNPSGSTTNSVSSTITTSGYQSFSVSYNHNTAGSYQYYATVQENIPTQTCTSNYVNGHYIKLCSTTYAWTTLSTSSTSEINILPATVSAPSEPSTVNIYQAAYTVTWNVNGFSSSNSLQTFLVEVNPSGSTTNSVSSTITTSGYQSFSVSYNHNTAGTYQYYAIVQEDIPTQTCTYNLVNGHLFKSCTTTYAWTTISTSSTSEINIIIPQPTVTTPIVPRSSLSSPTALVNQVYTVAWYEDSYSSNSLRTFVVEINQVDGSTSNSTATTITTSGNQSFSAIYNHSILGIYKYYAVIQEYKPTVTGYSWTTINTSSTSKNAYIWPTVSAPKEQTSAYINQVYNVTWSVNGCSSSNWCNTYIIEQNSTFMSEPFLGMIYTSGLQTFSVSHSDNAAGVYQYYAEVGFSWSIIINGAYVSYIDDSQPSYITINPLS